jgi:hypothetical protein
VNLPIPSATPAKSPDKILTVRPTNGWHETVSIETGSRSRARQARKTDRGLAAHHASAKRRKPTSKDEQLLATFEETLRLLEEEVLLLQD